MKRVLSLVFILVLCCVLCSCGKAEDYEAAVALMDTECYAEAIVAFAELGDYEDSAQRLEMCKGIVYEKAWDLLVAYEFEEAYAAFFQLGDYEDCEQITREWESIRSYMEAEKLYEAEQYEEALPIFVGLGEFRDSADCARECRNALAYENAVLMMACGEYEEAITAFLDLENYEDSAQRLEECKRLKLYAEAEELLKKERYEQAAEIFDLLGDYKDCAEKRIACDQNLRYVEAMHLQAEEKYEDALAIFTELGEFNESAEKAAECEGKIRERENKQAYNKAVSLMNAGAYAEAKEIFSGLDDYENSEAYWKICATKAMLEDPLYWEFISLLGVDSVTDEIDYGCIIPNAYGRGETEIYFELKNSRPPESEYTFEMGNGCNVRIPMTYGDLYETGWRVVETNWQTDYEMKKAKLSDFYPADEMIFCDMVGKNGKTVNFTLHNKQEEPVELRTVPVTGIGIYNSEMRGVYVNGITQGATVSEIVEAFGWPHLIRAMYGDTFVSIDLFYHGSEPLGENLTIYLDEKTGRLASFAYSTWPE